MAEPINKSLVIRTMYDRGMSMNQIAKATGIRYNMVYNVLERYRAHKNFKEPKKFLDKEEGKVLKKVVEEVCAELNIVITGNDIVRKE